MSQVIHDYSVEENARLLRHVREHLPPHGVLLVIEWLLRDGRAGPLAASLMALAMMVDTRGGRAYTFRELRNLLYDAGFISVSQRALYGPARLVIARKA
jgi:hypothetical protein